MIRAGRDGSSERTFDDRAAPQMPQFGELLRRYRVRRGMTQRQLADLSTVSIRAIRDIEQGRAARPRSGTVRLIADGLGLTGTSREEFQAAATRSADRRAPGPLGTELAPPPAPLGALVGRDREVAAVQNLLATGGQRLVAISGLGAVGKTRLALEVAGLLHRTRRFPVLWVAAEDLAPAGGAVAATANGSNGTAARQLEELLLQCGRAGVELPPLTAKQPVLLVLDDYATSHVRVAEIVSLLQKYNGLRILITTQEHFTVEGGLRLPLPPLRVPAQREQCGSLAQLARVPAVELFLQFMQQIQPAFRLTDENADQVATLCHRVDGIPAALAAVASWALIHGLDPLAQEAQADPLGLVGRMASEQGSADPLRALQRAIGAASAEERRLLATVAALKAGWSVADAAALTGQSRTVCGQLVQRLLLRGLLRPAECTDRPLFVVLELVRCLYQDRDSHPLRVGRLADRG